MPTWRNLDGPRGGHSAGRKTIETMVANYMAEGWDLPAPSAPAGRPLVRLAPLVAAKAEVYRAMRAAGVSKAELARRVGVSPQQAQRLFDICLAPRSN